MMVIASTSPLPDQLTGADRGDWDTPPDELPPTEEEVEEDEEAASEPERLEPERPD